MIFNLFIHIYYYRFISCFFFQKKTKYPKSVLYLAAFYPGNSGYNWRARKWADELKNSGYKVDIDYALDQDEFNGYKTNPAQFMIRFLRKRFWQVIKARNYEIVIVRRELLIFNDYGNLFLEKLLRRLCNYIILDFDDDLAASKKQPKKITSLTARLLLENGNSFRESFAYYDKFMVASNYLKDYVLKYASVNENQIAIIPTCVDYDKYPNKVYNFEDGHTFSFGWIGGDHNYCHLQRIIPVLNQLADKYSFKLIVIAGKPFETKAAFNIDFRPWSLETEVKDLMQVDVGLMPLNNTAVSHGKGGFKLLQYMGLGIVGVASDITINQDIVLHQEDSFLYNTNEELYVILESILLNPNKLIPIGKKARDKVNKYFTFEVNKNKYLDFIH